MNEIKMCNRCLIRIAVRDGICKECNRDRVLMARWNKIPIHKLQDEIMRETIRLKKKREVLKARQKPCLQGDK